MRERLLIKQVLGLTIFVFSLMMVSLPQAQAAKKNDNWCKVDKAPQIKISASASKIKYNFKLSQADLGKFGADTKSPYAKNVITDVGGLMSGGIEMRQQVTYKIITNPNYEQSCMWYNVIDVQILFDPTVYVAREYPQGTCGHNAILEHEMKHVQVDRHMVNKYAAQIGQAIKKEIDTRPLYGPVHQSQVKLLQQQMSNRMEQVLNSYSNIMDAERSLLQQKIDSIEEYERVDNLCEGNKK